MQTDCENLLSTSKKIYDILKNISNNQELFTNIAHLVFRTQVVFSKFVCAL